MPIPFWNVTVGCVEVYLRPLEMRAWLLALPRATVRMLKQVLENDHRIDVHTRIVVAGLRENEHLSELAASGTPLMWLEHFLFASKYLGRTSRAALLTEVLLTCWVCALSLSSFVSLLSEPFCFSARPGTSTAEALTATWTTFWRCCAPSTTRCSRRWCVFCLASPCTLRPTRTESPPWAHLSPPCGRKSCAAGVCFFFFVLRLALCFFSCCPSGSPSAQLETPLCPRCSWKSSGSTSAWGACASYCRGPVTISSAAWRRVPTKQTNTHESCQKPTQKASERVPDVCVRVCFFFVGQGVRNCFSCLCANGLLGPLARRTGPKVCF